MAWTLERLDNEPIILVTVFPPTSSYEGTIQLLHEIAELATTIPDGPIYRINDYSAITPTLDDLINVMTLEAKLGLPGSVGDPRTHLIAVGSGELVELGASSFSQDQFGNHNVPLFTSQDDALNYAREQLACLA